MYRGKKIAVIFPTYNEKASIRESVLEYFSTGLEHILTKQRGPIFGGKSIGREHTQTIRAKSSYRRDEAGNIGLEKLTATF